MESKRTAVILTLALFIAVGCRSTSVARRATIAPVDNSPKFALSRSSSRQQSDGTPKPAETSEDDADAIQQISAHSVDGGRDNINFSAVNRYSIRSAIEISLAQNPDLVSLRQAEGVGNAAVQVAETYPFNPFVQVQATPYQNAPNNNTINAGSGTTYHYVLLMQQIQLGGQQQFREEAAKNALSGIRWNVLQAELLNVAQTERLYFAAVYQQGLRDLAEMNAKNNRQLLEILEHQLQDGVATPGDVAIVRLDARSTRQQLRIAEANFQTALLDLKRHLSLPPEAKIELDSSVIRWNWQPAPTVQLTSMAANRPDVMAATSDAATARSNANLANGSRIPDVQIGPYYQRTDTGITFLGFRGQMDLPVLNNGVPLLRQREAEYCQRVTTSQQLAVRAKLEAEAAADRYERARQIRDEFADAGQSSVPTALQDLEDQFKAKEIDIQRVLQARISLLQSRRADLDTLNELMQSAVAITAASGAPLEMLVTTTEPESL